MCRRDCFGCALVRVNTAEEQQIFATMRMEREVLERDTVAGSGESGDAVAG
jgi:hypothetical protein